MSTATPSSDIDQARERVSAAYDSQLFSAAGDRLVDLLTDHLQRVQSGQGAVLPWRSPQDNARDAAAMIASAREGTESKQQIVDQFARIVEIMLRRGQNLHHPRYIGHQVPASVPLGGLFDAVGATTNQPMAIYEMGPWATAAEVAMVDKLGQKIGWQQGTFSGLTTHGGSLANLTALLTARNVALGDSWEGGLPRGPAPVIVTQADAHYCVGRSAGVLGIGTDHVVRVGLDGARRMDPNQLDETIGRLRRDGRTIVAVVACSCATPIGAFDPLEDIAAICEKYEVWLHVDAAHGGSACLSPRHRHLVAGLERADSVIWDAHKMMFVPALCAFVFLRDRQFAYEAFRQDAPYLFDPTAPGLAEFDGALRTVECTKRATTFGLWGLWSLFGEQLFTDLVDITFALGQQFHDKLSSADDFTPVHQPECNIVVFRHTPHQLNNATPDRVGKFQLALRRRLIESGEFYIVSTNIDGVGALRVVFMNPLTRCEQMDQLLDTLRNHGNQILEDGVF
jgi:L-2,4-diaminobutyrate decarboxylase